MQQQQSINNGSGRDKPITSTTTLNDLAQKKKMSVAITTIMLATHARQVGFMVQTYSHKLAGLEFELFHQVVNSLVFGSQQVGRYARRWYCMRPLLAPLLTLLLVSKTGDMENCCPLERIYARFFSLSALT